MCLLLADFLRETLAFGRANRIPLAGELALARRFLAIEQVRFGDRLQVDIGSGEAKAVDGAAAAAAAPRGECGDAWRRARPRRG